MNEMVVVLSDSYGYPWCKFSLTSSLTLLWIKYR